MMPKPPTLRRHALSSVLVGCSLALVAGDALAAKPTPTFRKAVETVWRKVPFSRMTGKSGKVQTWGVVLTDGLITGAPLILVRSGMWVGDICYMMDLTNGSLRTPEVDKQNAKKLSRPVPRGTVMKLEDVSFKDEGVVFYLSDQGHAVTRELVRGKGVTSEWESFCVLLQFSLTPSRVDRLDAEDAPKMLTTIESVLKPFSSAAAADEFAKTIKAP
jgi:hypothetical protein